ncbi:Wadjet anti-phage system protein JetD domain-containing protein [Gallaecimonas pentaromativorans]|uniref:Wadjet anti-phage system protein JetD domain-containing protein n=1 Tax=Gallaecimonas pentaromativorans TaxID=584787 RepID=UPI001E38C0CB|nr:Wadjet anti-phage system protein JetD domain-containing protein [Gallaecimonas pentaromativorans]
MMLRSGADACDESMRRLIKKAARAVFADGELEPSVEKISVSLPATNSSLREYYRLERFADREEYHARLQIYSNAKAIKVDWDVGAGERGQLSRVTLLDPKVVVGILGEELPWEVASRAIAKIAAVAKEGLPNVDHIIDAWRLGKAPAGVPAERANQLVDSMMIIGAAQKLSEDGQDVLLRKLSARLFSDSKRIEVLSRQLAFLLGEPAETEEDDVFARLGLVKHPQPMLLSGPPDCRIKIEGGAIPLAYPYLGFRPDTIKGLVASNDPIRRVLTIENLASFNEAADCAEKARDLLIVYLAGNPTPSFLAAYNRILKSLETTKVFHWGDIDVGGFKIAARLADSIRAMGYNLHLWRMNPLEVALGRNKFFPEKKIIEASIICDDYGWSEEAEGLRQNPVFQEQEFLDWIPPHD